MDCFAQKPTKATIPLALVSGSFFATWLKQCSKVDQNWIKTAGFNAKPGEAVQVPNPQGGVSRVVIGCEDEGQGTEPDYWSLAAAYARLPEGRYALPEGLNPDCANAAALGWALASYRFERYKKSTGKAPQLLLTKAVDRPMVEALARSIFLTRDLITTPASDMGPAELANEAKKLARAHKARFKVITGDALLKQGFPLIHAVGRASDRAPRLIDITWGKPRAPKVTLVGKGVCFDTGGLDLKNAAGMKMMKKDMGGAAQVLGLASMIMKTGLNIRLRVLIPAVENSVSGNAFRPLDVVPSRKGISVEIGNTDAEGRLVMADAITLALEEKPKMLVDFSTLTGAARVAVGTEISAYFCDSDTLSAELDAAGVQESDPVWRLPLHRPYRRQLDSKVAHINNIGGGGYAGAITAALFLQEFVGSGSEKTETEWAHFDIMAWNTASRPGRPEGGEAMGIRALFRVLQNRYG